MKKAKQHPIALLDGTAKPTEEQIQYYVSYFNENGAFPGNKIACNQTGKLTTCVGPWRAKKIAEYGSAEALVRNYVSKKMNPVLKAEKAALKAAKPAGKRGRKKAVKEEAPAVEVPKVSYNPTPVNESELAEMSTQVCLRPDIRVEEGNCTLCPSFRICKNRLRRKK